MTRLRARRLRHLALATTLVAALVACGSRVDVEDATGPGPAGGGGGTGTEAPPADAAEVGSIPNPCSDDAPEGTPVEGTPGVTDDAIRIGVISDRENPAVPLPTVGIEESMKAFVEYCNAAGGINGRKLELKTYDSQIAKTEDATRAACRDGLFALVGTGSVQDQQGVATREECGLPEVGAYSATSTRSESEDFFQPVVGTRSHFFNVGPCRWIAEQFPEAVKRAAVVYTDLPAASVRGAQIRDNCEAEAGFEFVVDEAIPFGANDYSSLVSQMKAEGVRYFTIVSEAAGTISLMEEMDKQGLELDVVDLGQQYYTQEVADAAVAEGAYVLTNTVPFSETDTTPALRLYAEHMEKVGASNKITTLGVQAFSAGLLFATAADALGAALTREGLVAELEKITSWDGGGLQMETNPGEDLHNECFLYMRLVDGEFVREFPEEGFQCNPDDVIETEQAYEN